MISKNLSKQLAAFFLINIVVFPSSANNNQNSGIDLSRQTAGGQSFIEGKDQGWFWYKDPPIPTLEEENDKVVKQKQHDTNDQIKEFEPIPLEASSTETIDPFSVAWFRENMQKLRDRAIDNPTQENVRAYYLAQRVLLDKASRFTDMARLVTSTDPLIDESSRRSTSTFGAMSQSSVAEENSRTVAKDISNKAGIFFFFNGENCTLCVKQAAIMQTFNYMTGINVIPISMDGKAMPGNTMNNYRIDTGQAEKLQIRNAPALALVIPPSTTRIISFGPISTDQLIKRTILVAHDAGIVSDVDYKSTLPYNDNGYIDSDILKDMPEDYLQNADEFIRFIQTKSGYASPELGIK